MQLPFTVTAEGPGRPEPRGSGQPPANPSPPGVARLVLFWAKPRYQIEVGATESEYWPVSSEPEAGR